MKSTALRLPARYSVLTKDEAVCIGGGSAIGDVWNITTGIVTGLASAGADVFGTVMRGETDPLSALCTSFVYLAGNVVASIIWRIA